MHFEHTLLQAGSLIVENLRTYRQPVIIYLPPGAELRGGAWVVIDGQINPQQVRLPLSYLKSSQPSYVSTRRSLSWLSLYRKLATLIVTQSAQGRRAESMLAICKIVQQTVERVYQRAKRFACLRQNEWLDCL